jgi:tetrahydromethanopterin S-methyltransferase subunit G
LDEIAEKTGFVNRFYMSRVFKKVTKESPAAYRKKHRSSDGQLIFEIDERIRWIAATFAQRMHSASSAAG